jgi:hypothetical protein
VNVFVLLLCVACWNDFARRFTQQPLSGWNIRCGLTLSHSEILIILYCFGLNPCTYIGGIVVIIIFFIFFRPEQWCSITHHILYMYVLERRKSLLPFGNFNLQFPIKKELYIIIRRAKQRNSGTAKKKRNLAHNIYYQQNWKRGLIESPFSKFQKKNLIINVINETSFFWFRIHYCVYVYFDYL